MSWNVLEGEVWWDPSTWNWDPQCPPAPESAYNIINATNITNATKQLVAPACTGYCAGFLYPLTWQIAEIREIIYPIFLYIFGILYTFFAIAIICDEFFVPALEEIQDRYDISADVAGATLMAAGGSAPELATSSIGTASESPVGFGTIVGSAVFNVLFVIGACAFAAPEELKLDWWPLFRDSTYYCFSLLVMAVFFGYLSPSRIYWYEAFSLFCLYVVYVFMMSKNSLLEQKIKGCINKCVCLKKCGCMKKCLEDSSERVHPDPGSDPEYQATKDEDSEEKPKKPVDGKAGQDDDDDTPLVKPLVDKEGEGDDDDDSLGAKTRQDDDEREPLVDEAKEKDRDVAEVEQQEEEEDDEDKPLEISWPSNKDVEHYDEKCRCCCLLSARIFFLIILPLNALFLYTVPDVRRPDSQVCGRTVHWKGCWFPAFLLSIGWIVCFSYMMVWWAEILGEVSQIHPTVVGLTLLAAGTSIPDLVSSVLVARKGEGNMAVSSSIGSNIFDILICLPLPWLTYSIYTGVKKFGHCTDHGDNHFCFSVGVYAETLLFSVILLIVMIFIVITIVHCSGWKMTKGLGVSMLVLYFLFVLQDVLRNCEMFPEIGRWFTWLRSNI